MAERRGRPKGALAQKVVTPLIAALTSAAIRYVVRKGPRYVEQTILPKLRDTGRDGGDAAGSLPKRAKSALSGAGDVAESLTERARTVAGGANRTASGTTRRAGRSADELERRRRARARHRASRRNSTK